MAVTDGRFDTQCLFDNLRSHVIVDAFEEADIPTNVHVCSDGVGFVEVGSGECNAVAWPCCRLTLFVVQESVTTNVNASHVQILSSLAH